MKAIAKKILYQSIPSSLICAMDSPLFKKFHLKMTEIQIMFSKRERTTLRIKR